MDINPSAQFAIEVVLSPSPKDSAHSDVLEAIVSVGGEVTGIENVDVATEFTVECSSEEHQLEVVKAIEQVENVTVAGWRDLTFKFHEGGKIATDTLDVELNSTSLAMAYTPGVARVCMAIYADEALANTYTIRKNTVAIVSDGTAVLGLGDIGPKAAMPVMEGKALLFKEFGEVDAFPICLDTDNPSEVIETVKRLAPTFGGINLEDIAAPGAFEIEAALKESLDIPVFHDDQHGTAIVALAALQNAIKVVNKDIGEIKVVMSGLGAAGIAISKIILAAGVKNFVGVDSKGAVHAGRDGLNEQKQWLAENTNQDKQSGPLSAVIKEADVFIGVSAPGVLTVADVETMAKDSIIFAMANPVPEIQPEDVEGKVAIMATGRSDYPNQINNVLAFPGIFRGALDTCATEITEGMKLAAAQAIANSIDDSELSPTNIVPSAFDKSIASEVASAVAKAAVEDGVASS